MDSGIMGPADLMQLVKNAPFKNQIDSHMRSVTRACRDSYALQAARDLVPVAELVQNNLDILEGDYQDNFLPLLVDWFSNDFFRWFAPPICESCNRELEFAGHSTTPDSKSMEQYKCHSPECNSSYDFIRHKDPTILLTTRQGRCGEWADCFMLMLRALDYDARIILDVTDHVWNEVWSDAKGRWVHVDPCEGVIDAPLLYEVGWKKNLEYCLAFSEFDVLDVTRRYSLDYNVTKRRRQKCDEGWLKQYLQKLSHDLLATAPNQRRGMILERRLRDIAYMDDLEANPRQIDDSSVFKGRKTGGITWRIQRGEYQPILKTGTILKAIKFERMSETDPMFSLYYNCDKDSYESSNEMYKKKCWSSLTYISENLDFKYERDWKTSYVARYETCPADSIGKLVWKIDFSELDEWKICQIKVCSKIYPGTSVEICLLGYDRIDGTSMSSLKIEPNIVNTIRRADLPEASKVVDLIVTLSGGDLDDEVSWQKPQLFRQTRGENSNEWALTIEIR